MKKYLIGNKPTLILRLIGLLVVTNALLFLFPTYNDAVVLYPANVKQPLEWYRFVVYPFAYVGGIGHLLYNSVLLLFTGNIIEPRMPRRHLVGLILLSAVLGGVLFTLFYRDLLYPMAELQAPFAGMALVVWGYFSAAAVYVYRYRLDVPPVVRNIMLVLVVFSPLSLASFNNYGVVAAQLGVVVTTVLLATRPGFFRPPAIPDPEPLP